MAKLPKEKKNAGKSAAKTEAKGGEKESTENGEQSHLTSKDEIASEVSEMISEFAGKRAGAKTTATKACALIYQRIMDSVMRDGYFRFPNGLGALRVQDVKGGPRTVPRTGDRIMTPDRRKIVYQMGKNVKEVLNKGVPDSHYIDEDGNKIDPPPKKGKEAAKEATAK